MKKTLLAIFCLFVTGSMIGQDLLEGAFRFSSKKDSYLYLKDGTEVIGKIKDIDRKKGLIKKIELKIDGKKVKYLPEDIDYMYLKPSGFDNFAKGYDKLYDATELNKDRTLNQSLVKEGYVLFQTVEVMIKKKKKTLLMQLLNPGYSSKIAVYFDPYASESGGMSLGGIKVKEDKARSYYVKQGDEVAYRLKKKKYKDMWEEMYKDCKGIAKKFKKKMKWNDFNKHILYYTNDCK